MSHNSDYSLADIGAIVRGNMGGFGGFGCGGDWMSMLALFLVYSMFGWGGFGGFGMGGMGMFPWMMMGGFPGMWGGGGNCGNGNCATPEDVRSAVDQQTLITKMDGQTYGIADLGYALQGTMNNGFSSAELSRCNGQAQTMQALANYNMSQMQNFWNVRDGQNQLSRQMSDCCCGTQRMIERGFCDSANRDSINTNAILQGTHNDTDRILARLDAMETNNLRDKLAKSESEKQWLLFERSQASQTSQLSACFNSRNCGSCGN